MKPEYSELPRTQAAAKKLGLKFYFTGKPCRRGHLAPRYANFPACVTCRLEDARRRCGHKARPSKEEYLEKARKLIEGKGGVLMSKAYIRSDSPLDVICSRKHRFQIRLGGLRRGDWCRECGLRPRLGIEKLRAWGRKNGLELVSTRYGDSGTEYQWRCVKAGHSIRRCRWAIQRSVDKGYSACTKCSDGWNAIRRGRAERADAFAKRMALIIAKLRQEGLSTGEEIATRLNEMGVATARGRQWDRFKVSKVELHSRK